MRIYLKEQGQNLAGFKLGRLYRHRSIVVAIVDP
jgi:hypothetical protein